MSDSLHINDDPICEDGLDTLIDEEEQGAYPDKWTPQGTRTDDCSVFRCLRNDLVRCCVLSKGERLQKQLDASKDGLEV